MTEFIHTATGTGGGGVLASFGSGEPTGRLRASADRGRANQNASTGQVRSLRSMINRDMGGLNTRSAAYRQRRALLQEIDDNTNNRGNIRMRVLADIRDSLDDLRNG